MQELAFGEQLPSSGNKYLKVKKKGEQIQFRIGQNPAYVGKHFLETDTGWNVPSCPRINSQEECEWCELYFAAYAELKKLKEAKADPIKIKELEREVRKYSPSTTFYFPILNRDTGKFGILQTTGGVRNKLNAQFEAGIKIMDKEWILRNTGSDSPQELYSVSLVDSADVKKMTPEEEIEFKKAQDFDKSTINDGASNSDEIEE